MRIHRLLLPVFLSFLRTIIGGGVFPLRMPEVRPTRNEVYLCSAVEIGTKGRYWVRGFKPVVIPGTMHHMAVVGCSRYPPVTPANVWNCGSNGNPVLEPGFPALNTTCSAGDMKSMTLFLWSRNGETYILPKDVGFAIGGDSPVQHLVLQVHYINVQHLPEHGDISGVDILYTDTEPLRTAGMMSVHVNTNVPSFSKTYQDGGCRIGENKILHPFSYLVHTHALGQVVSVWRVRRGGLVRGKDDWTLIGKKSPLKPQSFYPVEDKDLQLQPDDNIAIRCTMLNLKRKDVKQGEVACHADGPPAVTWRSFGFNNIPDLEASSLDVDN
ncbi:peptidylglycine alpha-hydroxylating monooxygenase isoform X2 [Eurytemora carolleeae]|uniref:peptidylglycine alpha-hydroxylating monooxygenase isoform X2 n=1 Tax=Eurytemora carolleeae TaxID=1294199 RepID=UPI000C794192|nr:peptidylglycine alpha-hydroxylating monooxygenase isoform X2 [Eurytemora carolleeae]|eukprot:XP_023320564.1 peptidylglycine alpha-hydroxylating monooxygenase-like isoform X2 [Eurytemora affinis]